MRDTRATRAALVAGIVLCTGVGTAVGFAEADAPRPGATAHAPTLRASVAPAAQQVPITEPLVITATGGTLTAVTVTGRSGDPVAGTLNEDRTRWTSAELDYDVRYTVRATGMGTGLNEGRPIKALETTFRTVRPNRTLGIDAFRPSEGQAVGVAMPISIYFNHPVRDKAAVERALRVTPSVPTEGSFNWVADDQVNWRPKHFWAPGTHVTVRAALRGVDAGSGTFGAADASSEFTVGKAQQAVGDTRAHTLTLVEDGKVVKIMPASFGRAQYPTGSGMHVAFEKLLSTRMRSDLWGGPAEGTPGFYDEVLPLAVRISGNGEFIHVNSKTVAEQGRANVSHGCVNLSPANGKAFFDWVQIGDPVNIIGSGKALTPTDGDIADWLTPWDEYTAGSALHAPAVPAAKSATSAAAGKAKDKLDPLLGRITE